MSAESQTVEAEVIPPSGARRNMVEIPRRVLASPAGTWFAWGFIGGAIAMGVAVYVIKKKL